MNPSGAGGSRPGPQGSPTLPALPPGEGTSPTETSEVGGRGGAGAALPPTAPPAQPRGAPRSRPPPRPDPELGLRAAYSACVTSQRAPPPPPARPHGYAVTSKSTTSPTPPRGLAERRTANRNATKAKQSKHALSPNPPPSPPAPPNCPAGSWQRPRESPGVTYITNRKAPHKTHYTYVRTCGSTNVIGKFLTGGTILRNQISGPCHRLHEKRKGERKKKKPTPRRRLPREAFKARRDSGCL